MLDAAIIGAGPYGLSVAAHLNGAGLRCRQFGLPMYLWRTAMPQGMFLKSQGFASSLSDPDGTHTLGDFCRETSRHYADYGLPVPLETFVSYGKWFQQHWVPDVEEVLVTDVAPMDDHYLLALSTGDKLRARNVVVATGLEYFPRVPDQLTHLPSELCSHSTDHDDLDFFCGRDVVVVGAGQSAMEAAALLNEGGASVRLVCRAPHLVWNGSPLSRDRSLVRRLREPEAGLGSGWSTWFYSQQPKLFRQLPARARVRLARTALGPAGAWWLRSRVEGELPVLAGHQVRRAESDGEHVRLELDGGDEGSTELVVDHVIAATGFRPDVARLPFLSQSLSCQLRTLDRTPSVGREFESSMRGLFFVGPTVAPSFGPVMRFVYGADCAARQVTRRITANIARRGAMMGAAR